MDSALLAQLLVAMTDVQKAQADALSRRDAQHSDVRLKIDQKLQLIHGGDELTFMEEMNKFETQMTKGNIRAWKDWWRYFEQSIQGSAKIWVDNLIHSGHGRAMHELAYAPGSHDDDFGNLYMYVRRQLMLRSGLQCGR